MPVAKTTRETAKTAETGIETQKNACLPTGVFLQTI
jgi:hypothetical protein